LKLWLSLETFKMLSNNKGETQEVASNKLCGEVQDKLLANYMVKFQVETSDYSHNFTQGKFTVN
jgi:hypothetical protein